METGVSRYMQELLAVPALRKDGARISIEFSIVILKSDEGEIAWVSGPHPRCNRQVGTGKSPERGSEITCNSRLNQRRNRSG